MYSGWQHEKVSFLLGLSGRRAALVGAVLFLFPNFSRSAETAPFYLHDGDKVTVESALGSTPALD